MQGLIEKRLLSMVLRMAIKKKAVQGVSFGPAPAEITGQDDYKKILVEQIILCLNNMVREMQLMRSKKDSSNTKNVAAKNSMPDITARQKINAKINAKSDAKSDAGKATIKRVQYLPVSEASLIKFGRRLAAPKIINSLLSCMEKYLTTQNDVISFRNCPVLLPPNPNADFIFEDAQKVDVRTYTTYYNHPGEAVQPRLNIKNLKFDFMFLRDLQKILDVLKKRYDHITYITLRYENNLRPYHIYDKSDMYPVFWTPLKI